MPLPAEVVFHRYFQSPELHPEDRRSYRGKQTLEALRPELAAFLHEVQNNLNETLGAEKPSVDDSSDRPSVFLDYIDAAVPNALAFREGDYGFIGVTMPLIHKLWDSCVELSRSKPVGAVLEVPEKPGREEAILTVLFQLQLTFVVTHEYAHHVRGRLSQVAPGARFLNEIENAHDGNLGQQSFELDADAYAAQAMLAELIAGPRREQTTRILGSRQAQSWTQDEILLLSFVMAVGAFLFMLPPLRVEPHEIAKCTHPLQAARMRWIMNNAINWCKQNDRRLLARYMTVEKFQAIMRVIATALSEISGKHDWSQQTNFLGSEAGSTYFERLVSRTKT